jgi:hypothetical protein
MNYLDQALALLKSATDHVPGGSPVLTAIAGLVYDGVRRIWPTVKPASFLHDLAGILRKALAGIHLVLKLLGDLAEGICAVIEKVAGLIDSVAPQNVLEAEKK